MLACFECSSRRRCLRRRRVVSARFALFVFFTSHYAAGPARTFSMGVRCVVVVVAVVAVVGAVGSWSLGRGVVYRINGWCAHMLWHATRARARASPARRQTVERERERPEPSQMLIEAVHYAFTTNTIRQYRHKDTPPASVLLI